MAIARAWLLVRVLPYSRLKHVLEALNGIPVSSVQPLEVQQVKWSIEAVSRRAPGSNCLVQAIAGTRLLRECGYAAEFKIGVAKPDQKFSAHAWVELYGRVVLGGADSSDRFTPFAVPEHRDAD